MVVKQRSAAQLLNQANIGPAGDLFSNIEKEMLLA
jgi:hypothetical protein